MRGDRILAALMMLGALILSACGSGYQPPSSSPTPTPGGPEIASLVLLASSSQLPSAANASDAGVTITAIAKDSGNSLVNGATITFSSDHGALATSSATTDSTGSVTNTLTAAGDPANQLITVTASSGSLTSTVTVQESGTSISVTGSTVVGSGDTASYTIKVVDSDGNGIQGQTVDVTSALGNPVSFTTSSVTDSNGQVSISYTGTSGGNDTLSASVASLSAAGSYSVKVSSAKLVFQSPSDGTLIDLGVSTPITVLYKNNGNPVSGATIAFSSTRGTLSSASAVTNASGIATVNIQSSGAGGAGSAIVTAQVNSGGPAAQETVNFVSTTPASIDIQATPSTVSPSASSTIVATVRDANNNLVQGQVVTFTLSDVSGGNLSAGAATTDQLGHATVTYTASTNTSAKNGVVISAAVQGTAVATATPAYITVGGTALNIALGTGASAVEVDSTTNSQPFSVFVTDSAGNPAPSTTTFRLSIRSTSYQKGYWDNSSGAWAWKPQVLSSDTYYDGTGTPSPYVGNDVPPFGCVSEDAYSNGIWTDALDYNDNGKLDPGNVAVVPSSVTLTNGVGAFKVTYPKDHANWVEVQLTAIATVAGNSTTATSTFVLLGLAKDYSDPKVAVPGEISPYGTASSCSDPS